MFILDEFLGTNIGGRFDHPSIESIRIDRIVRAGANVNLLVVNCHTNLYLFRGYEKEGEKGGERAEGKGLDAGGVTIHVPVVMVCYVHERGLVSCGLELPCNLRQMNIYNIKQNKN